MRSFDSMPAPGRPFIVMGLPRSGTTYLMTLLNAHRRIHCSGEQFNPYNIVSVGGKDGDQGRLVARDADPLAHMAKFFKSGGGWRDKRVGFKFMIGHNVQVLDQILADPELTLIHVWRANKLAQVSSWIKAQRTRKWAQTRVDDHVMRKIDVTALKVAQHAHEFATTDRLFSTLLQNLPHRRIEIEYCDMFAPDFNDRICDFLGVAPDPQMASPLVKQGANTLLDRFEKPEPIRDYLTRIGRTDWLEPEL